MAYNPYQQSYAPYGPGSHYPAPAPTPAPTPPGYAPGATQSTISKPGPGITSPSTSSLMNQLGAGLASLSSALASWGQSIGGGAPASSASAPGGTVLGQPTSFNYAPRNVPTTQPTGITPTQSFATPVSGLASELTTEEKKKKLNDLQTKVSTDTTPEIPVRTSLLDQIKGFFTPSDTSKLTGAMGMTTTGTTLPPTGQEYVPSPYGGAMQVSPALAEYMKQQEAGAISAPITGKPVVDDTSTYAAAQQGGDVITPPQGGASYPDTTNIWNSITKAIELSNTEILAMKKQLLAIASESLEPGRTVEDAAVLQQQIIAKAQSMYPEFEKMQGTITTIDKAIMDASIGFRKSAEALRNNPDLSMWQQTRRLQELEDMQNYAPIFDGLSIKDLISYRNQLADSMNYYSGLIKDATAGITGLTDLTTPAERMAKSAGYLGKSIEYSTQYINQLQGLAALLTPTYKYTQEINNQTGEVTVITWQVDPITQKQDEVSRQSLGNIGQRTVTATTKIPASAIGNIRALIDSNASIEDIQKYIEFSGYDIDHPNIQELLQGYVPEKSWLQKLLNR